MMELYSKTVQQFGDVISHEFPLAPEAVQRTYCEYWSQTQANTEQAKQDSQRIKRTNMLLSDFAGGRLSAEAYTATMLHGMFYSGGDKADNAAFNAIKNEYDAITPSGKNSEKRFVYGILSDFAIMDLFWDDKQHEMFDDEPEKQAILEDEENHTALSNEMWEFKYISTDQAKSLIELRKKHRINIESILIESIELLAWLTDESNIANDSNTLKKVHKAEMLYIPMCEIIGFDALVIELGGRCHEIRLINTEHKQFLDQARNMRRDLGDPNVVNARVEAMVHTVFGEDTSMLDTHHSSQVISHSSGHNAMFGDREILLEGKDIKGESINEIVRFIWRVKSEGSIARKLCAKNGKKPMDIIAGTVIVDSTDDVGKVLRLINQQVMNSPEMIPAAAPSRAPHEYMHVKGQQGYVESAMQQFGYDSIDDMKSQIDVVKIDRSGYQVAKITFMYQRFGEPLPLHVEIQVVTADDRKSARISTAAHAFMKLVGKSMDITEDIAETIADLHAQKDHLGTIGLASGSEQRSEEYEDFIKNHE